MNAGLKKMDKESSGDETTTLFGIYADFSDKIRKAISISPIALIIGTWVLMNEEFNTLTES